MSPNSLEETIENRMVAFRRFNKAYEDCLTAYKANSNNDAYARMVGALSVIIGFEADNESLHKIAATLEKSTKDETMRILARETV